MPHPWQPRCPECSEYLVPGEDGLECPESSCRWEPEEDDGWERAADCVSGYGNE